LFFSPGFPFFGIPPSPGGDGHTWVCDGSNVTNFYSGTTTLYSNGQSQTMYTTEIITRLLHMNWGWDDDATFVQDDQYGIRLTNNGWYDADTNYTQSDSKGENFPYFQILEYNIHP
jgi:hypothetical protein